MSRKKWTVEENKEWAAGLEPDVRALETAIYNRAKGNHESPDQMLQLMNALRWVGELRVELRAVKDKP